MWEQDLAAYLDVITAKYTKNLDHNSGDPIGMSVAQVSALNGRRTTASDAFLSTARTYFTIFTNTAIERILFNGQRAIAVQIAGKKS